MSYCFLVSYVTQDGRMGHMHGDISSNAYSEEAVNYVTQAIANQVCCDVKNVVITFLAFSDKP